MSETPNKNSQTIQVFTLILILGIAWSSLYWLTELNIKIYDYFSNNTFLNLIRILYGRRTFSAWLLSFFSIFDIRYVFKNKDKRSTTLIKDKSSIINIIIAVLSLVLHLTSISHILAPILAL